VAIRNEDWASIHTAIDEAIATLKPHGWAKAVFVLRQLGPLIGTIGVFLTLLAITLGALYQSFSHVKEEAAFRQHTEDRLTEIEKGIKGINGTIAALHLAAVSSNPVDSRSVQEVKKVLASARASDTKLDQSIVEDAGKKFIAAAKSTPDAWNAALAFLEYRTFLNTALFPKLVNPIEIKPNTGPSYPFPLQLLKPKPGTENEHQIWSMRLTASGGFVSPQDSARIELLSKPQPQGSGMGQFVIEGKADELVLDGFYLKNVTISDADVDYGGGPIRLENVVFINCRFHFVNLKPTRDLGVSILTASAVNFGSDVG